MVVFALISDLREGRISNWLVLTFYNIREIIVFSEEGIRGAFHSSINGLFVVGILFIIFAFGGLGGGDVKIFGVIGTFLGVRATMQIFAISIVISSIYIIIKYFFMGVNRFSTIRMMPSVALALIVFQVILSR